MFSLIIAIIAIALIVAVVAVGGYFGGDAVSDAQAKASAARLINEQTQIFTAMDEFQAENRRWPTDIQELVAAGHLRSVPVGAQVQTAAAGDFEIISSAHAADPLVVGWTMPAARMPIIHTVRVAKATCQAYNQASRGDNGILLQAFETLSAQCYGADNNYSVVVKKAAAGVSLASALPASVELGGLPSKEMDGWWDSVPDGVVQAPTDPEKTPKAELALHSGDELFPVTRISTTTKSETRVLSNRSAFTAHGLSFSAPSGFSVIDNTCGSELTPGANCTFALMFAPSDEQLYAGQVHVSSKNAQTTGFDVQGTGFVWRATLDIPAFGTVPVNSAADQIATLTNISLGDLPVSVPGQSSVSGSEYSFVGTTCREVLAPNASCAVTVRYSPTVATGSAGELSISTGAGAHSVPLAGGGISSTLSFSPTAIPSFGGQQINTSATSPTVTLRNNGGLVASGLALTANGAFSIRNSTCGATLASGAYCTFTVTFSPDAVGYYSGAVTAVSADSKANMPLSGQGVQGAVSFLAPATQIALWVGQTNTFDLQVVNSGLSSVALSGVAITTGNTAELSVASAGSTCGAVLAAGASCVYKGQYAPSARGARATATYRLTTSVGTFSAAPTALVGYDSTIAFSPSATLDFGTVNQGSEVTSGLITMSRTGDWPLVNYSLPAGYRMVESSCPASAQQFNTSSCSFKITFSPSAAGQFNGAMVVTYTQNKSASLVLRGTASALTGLQLNGSTFESVDVGTNLTRPFTLSNNSGAPVTLSGASVVGNSEFVMASSGTTCGSSLANGATCSYAVTFTPSSRGARSGATLTVASSLGNRTYALTGSGAQAILTLSANKSLDFGQRQVGSDNDNYATLTITNSGDVTRSLSLPSTSDFILDKGTCSSGFLNSGATCQALLYPRPQSGNLGGVAGNIAASAGAVTSNTLAATYVSVLPKASMSAGDAGVAAVGASSSLAITVTNTGVYRAVLGAPTITGNSTEFVLAPGSTCGSNLAAGASCSVNLDFLPSSAGVRPSATLSVNIGSNIAGGVFVTRALTGTGK